LPKTFSWTDPFVFKDARIPIKQSPHASVNFADQPQLAPPLFHQRFNRSQKMPDPLSHIDLPNVNDPENIVGLYPKSELRKINPIRAYKDAFCRNAMPHKRSSGELRWDCDRMSFFILSDATLETVCRKPGRRHLPVIVFFHKQISLSKNMGRTTIAYPHLTGLSYPSSSLRSGAIESMEEIRPLNINRTLQPVSQILK
jgi:hypothetical protein